MPSDDCIWLITRPNFTKLAWMVCLMMHLTGLDAEYKPYTNMPKVCQLFFFPYIFHWKQDSYLKGFLLLFFVRCWRNFYWLKKIQFAILTYIEMVFWQLVCKIWYFKHNTKIFFKCSSIYPFQYPSWKILLWIVNIKSQELKAAKIFKYMMPKS